ncbi:MAG TPA: hypothetical protein VK121_01990 [Pseudogracilibacillus sp.]|nr:hypothetical protein [Pseudogracilibacillus sp.]
MLTRQIKRVSLMIMTLVLLIEFSFVPISLAEENIISELEEMSTEIINWKKSESEISSDDNLLNNQFLENAGSSSGDWFPIGIGRLGYEDDYDAYLAVINDVIAKRYDGEHKLDRIKATEWHRISLAVLALGGDPTAISDGSIDLIADGTYNRSKVMDLGKQGINGLTWGLLTLDSMRYKVPKNAADSREDIIKRILEAQLEDGGFSLKSPPSNADITGMTLQALAPYYNSEKVYTYIREIDDKKREVRVRDVVDEALEYLTSVELDNPESTVQVIVALTALQIDPLSEEFIRDDQTLFDILKEFKRDDGGFVHSYSYDPDNPTSKPNESNSMASEQALYGLTSMLRYYSDSRTLYDFREEMSLELKNKIKKVESEIEQTVTKQPKKEDLKKVYENYLDIPAEERSYVSNYAKLSDALTEKNIKKEPEELSDFMDINSSGKGTVIDLVSGSNEKTKQTKFTEADVKRTEELMKETSTKYEVEVIKLINLLKTAENKADYENDLTILEEKQTEIEALKKEIEKINQLIMKELYPFEAITEEDEATVKQIIKRYDQLAEYDQTKVQNYEDVEKADTQIKNLKRAKIMKIIFVGIVIILVAYLIYRRKKRKQEKSKQNFLDED